MKRKGFTLLEVLLVVALLGILAGIVLVALNPASQLAKTRNAQRASDIRAILDAVWQYSIDNSGDLPATILETSDCLITPATEICKTGGANCDEATNAEGQNFTDLSVLIENQEFLTEMPVDPTTFSDNGVGYHIVKSANGRVTVCAPAELGETVEVTR